MSAFPRAATKIFRFKRLAYVAAALCTTATLAQTRLPTIPSASYFDEQKQAAAEFEAARKFRSSDLSSR